MKTLFYRITILSLLSFISSCSANTDILVNENSIGGTSTPNMTSTSENHTDIESITPSVERIVESIGASQEDNSENNSIINNIRQQLAEKELEIQDLKKDIDSLNAQLSIKTVDIENLVSELSQNEEYIKQLNLQISTYISLLEQETNNTQEEKEKVNSLEIELEACNLLVDLLNDKINSLNDELSKYKFECTVDFDPRNGQDMLSIKYLVGQKVEKPSNPRKDNYSFLGWYYDNKPVNFDDFVVRGDITLVGNWAFSPSGNTIEFGMYPQKEITSSSLSLYTSLNLLIDEVPSSDNNRGWIEYCNFEGYEPYRWYKDYVFGGKKYRAIYFRAYEEAQGYDAHDLSHTYITTNPGSNRMCGTYSNGYRINKVYWFEFEPIEWEIFDIGNKKILVSPYILESRCFNKLYGAFVDEDDIPHFISSFNYSDLNNMLNTTFLDAAFSKSERDDISHSIIKNGVSSSGWGEIEEEPNVYSYGPSSHYVYMLSYEEYNLIKDNINFTKTDYSKCLGLLTERFWLRSPYDDTHVKTSLNGVIQSRNPFIGVVPIIQLGD